MKKLLLISTLLLGLSACAPKINYVPVTAQDSAVSLPLAQPLSLNPVNWDILTQDNAKTYLASKSPIFILNADGYTNFQLNLNEIARYIQELQTINAAAKQILDQRAANTTQQDAVKPQTKGK